MEEFKLDYSGPPDEAIKWCRERGYRAYGVTPMPGTFAPCLLIAKGAELIGIAEPDDVLVFRFGSISIRVHS